MIDQFVHSAMEVFRNTTGELRAVEQEERHHGTGAKTVTFTTTMDACCMWILWTDSTAGEKQMALQNTRLCISTNYTTLFLWNPLSSITQLILTLKQNS